MLTSSEKNRVVKKIMRKFTIRTFIYSLIASLRETKEPAHDDSMLVRC